MPKTLKTMLRILAGILLILTLIPPVQLNVMNVFVLVLPGIGTLLLLFPLLVKAARHVFGSHYKGFVKAVRIAVSLCAVYFAVTFCVIFFNSFGQQAPEDATVIVLGAKVQDNTPTLILQGRIDAAGQYLRAHPNAVCIASGGQGSDETMTEAECIQTQLISLYGINESRIYLDPESVSTAENVDDSYRIITGYGLSTNVLIATDGFHLFRAKLLASRRGLTAYGLPARTTPGLVLEFYVREMIGLPKSVLLNQ